MKQRILRYLRRLINRLKDVDPALYRRALLLLAAALEDGRITWGEAWRLAVLLLTGGEVARKAARDAIESMGWDLLRPDGEPVGSDVPVPSEFSGPAA